MISSITPSFRRAFAQMNAADQQAARRAYRLFADNPNHNSLRFKKLGGYKNLWSVRVTLDIRAVGQRDGEAVVWVWIGTHKEFDGRFG